MLNLNSLLLSIWVKRCKRGPMDPVQEATLLAGKGIVDNANQGGKRQVTFIEEEIWNMMNEKLGTRLDPRVRRVNLMIGGFSLLNSRGKILQIGASVKIRIYGETKPCERMEEAQPGLQAWMYPDWRGGAFGEVLEGGVIRVGDEIRLLN